MRLMVYSHDTFGLGNIRRMLAICTHLLDTIPNLSILLVSGSPMLQSFRLPQGLDYIKLPCVNRGESGQLSAKYLSTDVNQILQLRADLILSAALNFKPDLFLVDKKPEGLRFELTDTLNYLKTYLPQTKIVLLLRDILDHPNQTIQEWQENRYYDAIELFYDRVLVVGMPEVFDLCQEYNFPDAVAHKVQYCGYIRKEPGLKSRHTLRQELALQPDESLVLITPGGGEDGYRLVETYLNGFDQIDVCNPKIRSLIICGSEMPVQQRERCYQMATGNPRVQVLEFTDDLMSYIEAADLVVCMSGYNTVSEVLSLAKPAIVVPRIKPAQEQLIRAERMAAMGLLHIIHPHDLSSENLSQAVLNQLSCDSFKPIAPKLDLEGLPRIAQYISNLLFHPLASLNSTAITNYQSAGSFVLSGRF